MTRFLQSCLCFATVLAASLTAGAAHAQFGVAWRITPAITIIGADAGDPRFALVEEAIAFWNRTLEEQGSGFRLGAVTRLARPVPEDALRTLSDSVLSGRRGFEAFPAAFRELPGDLVVALADSDFISFAGPFSADAKRVVGIRSQRTLPLNLPNVARNVITHELGHAIGLGHNSDPAMLMCGRPAPCRPDLFRSAEPRLFPLTDDEKRRLLALYPPQWKPQPP